MLYEVITVMASDPDSDRLGLAVKNDKGEYILVNGNQTATLLTWYIIKKWKEFNKLTGNEYIVKTIVTSELIKEIAVKNGIEYFDVYTGFKWIAKVIRDLEGQKKYICGGEESYGFLPGDYVRDKDAVARITSYNVCYTKLLRIIKTAQQNNYHLKILEAVEEVNNTQKTILNKKIIEHFHDLRDKTFAVWGLSFKPHTDDMREAPSLSIINKLLDMGAKVKAYDPVAMKEAQKHLGNRNNFV